MFDAIQVSPELTALLNKAGDSKPEVAIAAQREIGVAIAEVIRKGIMPGNILDGIFSVVPLSPNGVAEFDLDLLSPGTEKDFTAFTSPNHGRIPEKHVEGDYVTVPTYRIANSIDTILRLIRSTGYDVVQRMTEVLMAGFVKKMNDDGAHTLLAAGVDRNIVVFDSDASAGQFTKRLVTLMQVIMRRNGGGNSTSIGRAKLTDLVMSPESMADIRNWGVDQIDELTRRDVFNAVDILPRIFGVNLHDWDELGENQEYQTFFTGTLAGSLAASDVELFIGLDLNNRDSFKMPVREDVSIYEDPALHRQGRFGYYGWAEVGFAALNNQRIILGSC